MSAFKARVCVVGLGYIGLPSAALLANRGYSVLGVDISTEVVETINQGKIHIVEPDLDSFVHSAVNSGRLIASLEPKPAEVFILAVPTPFYDGFVPNIDYVLDATKSISKVVKNGDLIILESTSPVGTTEKVVKVLQDNGVDTSGVYVAHCPERVLPGQIMRELVENDRVVGGITLEATKKVKEFYQTFVTGQVLTTDARTAEMTKLTENSFRDVNIAFANELSVLADKFKIDVWELIRLANRHPRVDILNPGTGVGGHCIAVDPWFIIHEGGDQAKLIRSAREVNVRKTDWVVDKIKSKVELFHEENGYRPVLACMGLAFKPNIDDLRESPALLVFQQLISENIQPLAVEPNLESHASISLTCWQEAAKAADIIVYLVGHREFQNLEVKGEVLDFCGITQS